MSEASPENWQAIFFGGAAVFVLLQMARGWQLGVVRMIASLLAIAGAYISAWIAGPELGPMLRPLNLPDPLLNVIAGAGAGLCTFVIISLASAVLFKKTSDQTVGFIRFGYGLSGAAIGLCFGLILVWAATVGVRVIGTIAQKALEVRTHQPASMILTGGVAASPAPPKDPGPLVRGMAQMKESLDQGAAGAVMQQVDPVPGKFYDVIGKIGALAASEQSLERFLAYPGVKPLADHPKILELRDDPQIARAVMAQNYLALLQNPRLIQVANDPEILGLMAKFEFENALDYALVRAENAPVRHRD